MPPDFVALVDQLVPVPNPFVPHSGNWTGKFECVVKVVVHCVAEYFFSRKRPTSFEDFFDDGGVFTAEV